MADALDALSSPRSQDPEKSVIVDRENIKKDFKECLTSIQSKCSFALFEPLPEALNPEICLKNGGTINLPLSDSDAQVIIAASREAPFGKGEETIVDTNVRKTWEVSPNDFELKNATWQPFVESIVAKVSVGLGVDANGKGVSAELYKMLLYDEGAMFKPHQEFADVTHEVKPVTSGRRLVLTYNLAHQTLDSKKLTADSDICLEKLRVFLPQWQDTLSDCPKVPKTLAFLLEHKYTDANLRHTMLKGHDQQVVSHLREACEELGLCVYLANLQREAEGGCDIFGSYSPLPPGAFHEVEEYYDLRNYLTKIVNLDGTELAGGCLDFDEETLIQTKHFEDATPDDEDFSGFTGNEGVSATHFYHRTVAIFMPKDYRIQFCFPIDTVQRWKGDGVDEKVLAWINRVSARLLQDPNDQSAREDLQLISKLIIRGGNAMKTGKERHAPFSDEVFARNFKIAIDLDDKSLFVEAVRNHCGKASRAMFQSVGTGLLHYDLQTLLPEVASLLSAVCSLSGRLDMIEEVRQGLSTEAKRTSKVIDIYFKWLESEIDRTLSSEQVIAETSKDGLRLAKLSMEVPKQQIFNNILPAVKRNVSKAPMALSFLVGIFDAGQAGNIPKDVSQTIFKDILSDVAETFSFHSLSTLTKVKRARVVPSGRSSRHFSVVPSHTDTVLDLDKATSRDFALLVCNCLSLGLESSLEEMVTPLTKEAATIDVDLFEPVYLPALKVIGTMLQSKKLSVQGSPVGRLFQSLLTTYIARYVGAEPVPPSDWQRTRVACVCSDCSQLNAFLVDPIESVWRFAANQTRRTHLQKSLKELGNGTTVDTERGGSPLTLVVIKTQSQHLAVHTAWTARCDVAKKQLQRLDQKFLQECLAEEYENIMFVKMDAIVPAYDALVASIEVPAETDSSNRVPSPISKRKVPAPAKS